jgi:ankyrin repeat protein
MPNKLVTGTSAIATALTTFADKDDPTEGDFAKILNLIETHAIAPNTIIPNKWGNTLLGRCAYQNQANIGIRLLDAVDPVSRAILVNTQNTHGNTPLMQCIKRKADHDLLAKILETDGIDLTLKNKDGKTALDLAHDLGKDGTALVEAINRMQRTEAARSQSLR